MVGKVVKYMCAISGAIHYPVTEEEIQKMLSTMERRGPDGQGVYRSPEAVLLHARLAIIDPVGGAQPMKYTVNGETYILVYNGEIYNTDEVKQELIQQGHVFLGHSDTEVVLHAYAQWGETCVNILNGIFAFAVWEKERKRLFLARDRMGVKPFFYTERDGGFLFASEMKTLFAISAVCPTLDRDGAYQILLFGPGRIPGSGVFHNIWELEPGCCGFFENGKLRKKCYWKLTDHPHTDSFEETVEKVRFLVLDSIRRQMISDVPLGTFLSGGLDSSIISAVCARSYAAQGKRLDTFSVDYENNDCYFQAGKFQPTSDPAYIIKMQESIQSSHHWTILSPEDLVNCLEDATIARDLPGMADVDFSLLALCREIRKDVKVALSGECADEIFGGYPWYRDPQVRAKAGFPWAQTTEERSELMASHLKNTSDPRDYVMDAYLDTCHQSDILPENSPEERRMKEMVNLNFRWFMQTLLDRKDRMSMNVGLEVRVPFCDYRIAEYLYSVPWRYKDYQGREKGLLRCAVQDLLPAEILTRKKSPYPKTFDPRYEQIMAHKLQMLLQKGDSPLFCLVDKEKLQKYLTQAGQWPWYGQLMRRPQTISYFLQIDFWLRHYQVDFSF